MCVYELLSRDKETTVLVHSCSWQGEALVLLGSGMYSIHCGAQHESPGVMQAECKNIRAINLMVPYLM